MANSILTRLIRLFKSSANDALDAVEDPGALARQMVRELASEVARTEEAVAAVLGEYRVLTSKRDEAKSDAEDWNNKAAQAVKGGRDDLATAALERAERAERSLVGYEQSVAMLSPKVAALKAKLTSLRKKKDDAESEADVIAARASAASASSRATRVLGGVGDSPVDFDHVRNRVMHLEATAEALDEVASEKTGARLEAELAALSSSSVADRLAKLKTEAQGGAQ